jgi:hypothetical protein
MTPQRFLFLRHLLLGHLERLHGNMFALAREIKEADSNERGIDRRKLATLLHHPDKDVALRLRELEALDDYLAKHGQSLASVPIFGRPAILEMLASKKHVDFLVGVRIIEKNLGISYSDTLAHGDIGRFLNRKTPVTTALHVVLMGVHRRAAHNPIRWPWEETLQEAQAVVAIASPLSNLATNTMLELMFGTYSLPSSFGGTQRPPFSLVVPEERAVQARSAFVEGPANLEGESAKLAGKIHDYCWGVRVGNRLLVSEEEAGEEGARGPRLGKTYGVIIAQRRASGAVWVAVAGLHGAGTHAAARALAKAEITLESEPQSADGPVHVRVVEALVSSSSLDGAIVSEVVRERLLPEFKKTSFPPPSAGGDSVSQKRAS